jgi:hypothetical protein
MEPLNIPYIADTTISGGTFQTPIMQNITHGNNSKFMLNIFTKNSKISSSMMRLKGN